MTTLPDFASWAVFAKVVELQSFSAASQALCLSPGTVSKAISRLEERIGTALIHRSTRKLSVTPAGEALARRAQALLADAQAMEAAVEDETGAPRGLVRVAAPLTFGISHIAPLLPDLARKYPDLTIDLQVDDAVGDIVASGFDLAIRIGRLKDSSLRVRQLATNRTMVVGAPAYLARRGTPTHPTELSAHACLGYTSMPPADSWCLVDRAGQEVRVRHSGPMRTNNGILMLPLLLDGCGLAFVPEFFVADHLASGALVHVLPEWSMPPTALYLVTPASVQRPPRVTAVIDFFVERLGRDRHGRAAA